MAKTYFPPAPQASWQDIKAKNFFEWIKQRQASNEVKLKLAKDALSGKCFSEGETGEQKKNYQELFHAWLRWVLGEDRHAVVWWHWIGEKKKREIRDRDEFTIELWQSMNDTDGKNKKAREQAIEDVAPWSYYKGYFFNWFLTRHNTVGARQVFNDKWWSRYIHLPVGLLTIGIVAGFFGWTSQTRCEWLCAALLIALVFVVGNLVAWIRPAYYLQSLIPRMAVTTALGYLFLFSASGLVKGIYYNSLPPIGQLTISLALVLFVLIYMIQVIQRRVVPRLNFGQACKRSLHLLCLGLAYSAIGLLISAPVLFSSTFLNDKPGNFVAPASPTALLTTAALGLVIGVVLQLVWDDKPVTEPF